MHAGDYYVQPERLTGPADVVEEFIICQPCMAQGESHYFPLVNQVWWQILDIEQITIELWKVQDKCDKTAAQLPLLKSDRLSKALASILLHFNRSWCSLI